MIPKTRQIIARAHRQQLPIEDISLLVDLPVENVSAAHDPLLIMNKGAIVVNRLEW